MCRLFGMSAGGEQARATFWLLDAPDSLRAQSRREPDGTGLGWFDARGRPHVSKQPIAACGDREFGHEAREVASTTFVAHIRFASTGGLETRNTHPFEQNGRLFAHNGVIGDLAALDAHLADSLELVRGDTDSERFFALITREAAAHDGDVSAGIVTACSWIAAHLPVFAMNFVLTSPDGLWALRYPDAHDLFVLERQPGRRLEHLSGLGTRVRSEHTLRMPVAVLASERMDSEPGWRKLAAGELLHVSESLEVTSQAILEHPPTRQLTLADLSARARSSQAHAAGTPS
jgi:predicted glutamine amidotransferase